MRILVAGRLGRYAERILALRELGHEIVYCTMPAPRQSPIPDALPGSVPQYLLASGGAADEVRRIVERHHIDVIYSLKNVWDGSLELVSELLDAGIGPIVRHYKEHFCQPGEAERRSLTETAGQIYINEASLSYFQATYGVRVDTAHLLDTDYLPARYMTDELASPLSDLDGEPHLLVAGGVSSTRGRTDIRDLCDSMRRHRIHVHIYGGKYVGPDQAGVWGVDHAPARREYDRLRAQGYLHLHDHIPPQRFTPEWSRYDAGLMHVVARDTHDAAFQRMNRPNRLVPYLAAGLPVAQQVGGQDAMERLVSGSGLGFLFHDHDELAEALHDRPRLRRLRRDVVATRGEYTFESHAGRLADVLSRYAGRV